MMEQMPPMEEELLKQKIGNISAWFGSNINYKYFMLLNNDRRDYTIFNVESHNYHNAYLGLMDCVNGRGEVISVDYDHDNEYYEIWIRCHDTKQVTMYVVFPCNDFVIDC